MEEYSLGELGQTEKEKTYDVSSRQYKKRDTKEQIYTTKVTQNSNRNRRFQENVEEQG